ncbi:SulP family sulfate permease [Aulographum hederae CBS 113979]|uniref:SulP family sulfate permease n=1 Tax=Aulographum hederae CBS 113979 TaxID=1176131 RepID=A0A6G1H8S9_9PEZI|nr:SulP family sulfate permease [Aulographum hederae CBS 113979]
MVSTSTKIGHGLAKVLGIKLDYRDELGQDKVTRGESVFSISSADTYTEQEPTAVEWLQDLTPSGRDVGRYFYNLFPFLRWITRYNVQWLIGDLVAGITVGAVVVPQSMAYAKLANLDVEFGLYSSFMGVLIYWFFATSKDITIGPVAVLSTVVGNVISKSEAELGDKYLPEDIAGALAIISGAIVCFLGLARLGWLVDFISLTAISAFMTGSALNIAVGQVPAMMGITGFSNRESTYKVVINILKHLGRTNLNAAMGLTALTMLYLIRWGCNTLAKRFPERRKMFFFLATLRTAFVILLYTMISWLVNRHRRDHPAFTLLGKVPRVGFQHARVPVVNSEIISSFTSELPATVIVLLIEHISISKSFGRVNNYTIDPSQELVAIGVTNLLGPFLGAYPATGSFSRTAIKSKAGVRTPFAGVITALVVLLAIYALPAVFFYIPNASLSAVIIHAVGDLITPPNTVYQFWRISPLEVFIFFAGVFVTIFSNIENGIYTTVCVSAALLLFRIFKARGRFMGKVKIHSVIGDHLLDDPQAKEQLRKVKKGVDDDDKFSRNIFLPINHMDGSNPEIEVHAPYPGVFIYRFSEGYNYPNANHYLDDMVSQIFKQTRRTNPTAYGRLGDRPWNDPGPRRGKQVQVDDHLPCLKAIILDFSSVNNVDITSVQHLIDVRNQLDRYTAPDTVEWHFAHIQNRWTKRALVAAGFGYPALEKGDGFHRWKAVFDVAEIGGNESAAAAAERRENKRTKSRGSHDVETPRLGSSTVADGTDRIGAATGDSSSPSNNEVGSLEKELSTAKAYGTVAREMSKVAVVQGLNRPMFHIDLTSALQSAIENVERRGQTVVEVDADKGVDDL